MLDPRIHAFSGLSEVIALLNSFSFSASDIAYLRTVLPQCEEAFFVWLGQLDCQGVRVYSLEEGSLCFPRVPLIRVEVRTTCAVRGADRFGDVIGLFVGRHFE